MTDNQTRHENIDPESAMMYADLLAASQNCYLMYQALIEAGFTEMQAIQLVGTTLGGQR